jgi:hypothetical protein
MHGVTDRAPSGPRRWLRFLLPIGLLFALALVAIYASLVTTSPEASTESTSSGGKEAAVGATTQHTQTQQEVNLAPLAPTEVITRYGYLPLVTRNHPPHFTFAVTADMREFSGPGQYDTSQYFRGACEAIAALGGGPFMVSPGDIDPPADVEWTIKQYIGQDYIWYPVVGNHEAETAGDMTWLRAYDYDANGAAAPNIVNSGPPSCEETTYSFDYANTHFVALNEYCDESGDTSTDGDVGDVLYNWLVDDLSATGKTHIFVFGHEPAYPQPDAESGRPRHVGDSLDKYEANRDRFWNLLRDEGVVAYVCGHTHNYSALEQDGVWQLDAAHARGKGDTGARSTFILIHVSGDVVTFETYRYVLASSVYALAASGVLTGTVVGGWR